MRTTLLLPVAALTLFLAAPTPVSAQQALPLAVATSPASHQFELQSRVNSEEYVIRLYVPPSAPPSAGFPVLYVLDGSLLFNTFADAMRNRSQAAEIEPAVIVGISSAAGPAGGDRTYDFTWTDLTQHEKSVTKDLGSNPRFGGAPGFFGMIQNELKPRIGAMAPIDVRRQALLGWSLGGLFVTHTMLEHPNAFATYIALSPSLWQGNRAVFKDVDAFKAAVVNGKTAPNIFLGVGGREEDAPGDMRIGAMTHDETVAELRYCRMVGNFRDLVSLLKPVLDQRHLAMSARVFDDDSHNSLPWSAVNPVLNFAFPASGPPAPFAPK